ncbi:hypothetical protein I3843_01G254900 [Carya illinoinensis]|nr:hypothetical protein CIPAW_01G262600 [Carya illinoinensis]KAG6669709.1 hypothetical protein CIPAW_01G262600 [Carya illinoinensis]KAG6669710.1 hypothetical protein CIPAW_01G262600 [Carya illinoinensis]KAG6734250.1 hypothetical protein I3842_01G264400 [Carya illinoinensis]KAG7998353.1 hypothetical protein I3843_01G254900 [Carya illinoinensis]
MQRGREGADNFSHSGDLLGSFWSSAGFGSRRSMMPSLFGDRDPFDDPFFTRPFGSLFDSGMFSSSAAVSGKDQTSRAPGIVIEELNSDDEGKTEKGEGTGPDKDNGPKNYPSSQEPSIEHPDDDDDDESKNPIQRIDRKKVEGAQSQDSEASVQTCRVTYGGVNGAYYTSTRTTRTGADGVVLEEAKEADRTTGQAKHRISRGIHDKGHSVTRKLNSDGKLDTSQTLYNLNEDELAGFEEAWKDHKGNVKVQLPGREDGFGMHGNAGSSSSSEPKEKKFWGGLALPSLKQPWKAGRMRQDNEARNNASSGRSKKVVRINID